MEKLINILFKKFKYYQIRNSSFKFIITAYFCIKRFNLYFKNSILFLFVILYINNRFINFYIEIIKFNEQRNNIKHEDFL